MVTRWAAGERPTAEDYLDAHPHLWRQPDAAFELIAEELALRDEYGCPATGAELAVRFPGWADQVAALAECQRALGPQLAPPAFPAPGDRLGEFVLVEEIGRGAHGRVYRAEQPHLADRPVVLKVTPAAGGEHLSLARIQHTHVVPLFSAHEFPDRRLRGLCMPWFAGTTLDKLPPPADAGRFGCHLAACLADALDHAHARNLLHLDLKPSNVLVAGDGTPMLLDFHLARPPLDAGDPAPAWVGGTPDWMAPEQQAALAAVRAGLPVPAAVDARADVFALGRLLRHFLRSADAAVSCGLTDILDRATAADAARRYPSAAAFAVDLRRHLADLPLVGVRNRSLGERWQKWRRRHPAKLPALLVAGGLLAAAGGVGLYVARQIDRAGGSLRSGSALAAGGKHAEAVEAFRGGERLVAGLPFAGSVRDELSAARRAAEQAAAGDELHALCERARRLASDDTLSPPAAGRVAVQLRAVWDRRTEFAAADERTRADLADVGVLAASLGVRADESARPTAVALLADVESAFGPSAGVEYERAVHIRGLDRAAEADAADRRAGTLPRRTAWDHLSAGRALLSADRPADALTAFDFALSLSPGDVWPHHYRGVCLLKLNRPAEAAAAFASASALAPGSGWPLANRGLAFAAAGLPDAAAADFDRALSLDPSLTSAYLGRAGVRAKQKRFADAHADLDRAAVLGADVAAQRAAVVSGSS